jgi:hypothetical protein
VPWISLFSHRQTWAFIAGKLMADPVWWFYLYWLPKFLDAKYGVKLAQVAAPIIVVYLIADVGSVGGGWTSSALIKRGWSVNRARKTTMLAMALLIVPTALVSRAPSMWAAVLIVGVAAAAHQAWSANVYTLASDMFPTFAVGSVVGIGSFAGAMGGVAFQRITGRVLQANGSDYAPIFAVCGLAYVTARVDNSSPPPILATGSDRPPNTLSEGLRAAGWVLLFDGKTFDGWRGLGYDSVPSAHWKIEDGTIRKLADGQVPRMADGQPAAGGDLMSRDTFTDFVLTWDWKISRAGNSGVKYNVSEAISMASAPNHAALGFEYQMLDDSLHEDNKVPSHRAGALYDLIPPNVSKVLAPVGEWNTSAIVFRGNHGEHWLNGRKVVEYELDTPRMDSLLAKSKYRDIKGFAEKRAGHIVLQDHVDEVYFRSIRIRRL